MPRLAYRGPLLGNSQTRAVSVEGEATWDSHFIVSGETEVFVRGASIGVTGRLAALAFPTKHHVYLVLFVVIRTYVR